MVSWRRIDWKDLARRLVRDVDHDHVCYGAAALAFYLVLALFPALIFGLSALAYVPIPELKQATTDLVHQALPGGTAAMVTSSLDAALGARHGGIMSFGLLFALASASHGTYAVMRELNVVYHVPEKRSFVRARGIALLLTLACIALAAACLALVVGGGKLQSLLGDHYGWSKGLLVFFATLRWVLIALALTLGFALLYYFGPSEKRPFTFVTLGSIFGTAGIVGASLAIRLYADHVANYGAIYGGLGGVIVLLLWLFVAGWVVLLGGEINQIVEDQSGERRSDVSAAEDSTMGAKEERKVRDVARAATH